MKISQLYIYPIKSLREVAVSEAVLTSIGFKYDRRFMLLKVKQGDDGSETLQNMHVPHFPEMSLFLTNIVFPTEDNNGKIIVTYRPPRVEDNHDPRIKTLEVPLEPDVRGLEKSTVTIHQSPTTGYHMGSKYSNWFSQCFGYKVVLVYLGPHWRRVLGSFPPGKSQAHCEKVTPLIPTRSVAVLALLSLLLNVIGEPIGQRDIGSLILLSLLTTAAATLLALGVNRYGSGGGKRKDERITFADTAPYLVISEKSVDDVTARLAGDEEMDLTKSRPNIVISGAETAFEEDFWAELTVKDHVRLLLTANCIRCQSLNVDYTTGKMGTGESGTIFKKLMKDRRVDKGARFSPVFGRYSFLDQSSENASIRVGDEVVVSRRVEERTTYDWPGLTN